MYWEVGLPSVDFYVSKVCFFIPRLMQIIIVITFLMYPTKVSYKQIQQLSNYAHYSIADSWEYMLKIFPYQYIENFLLSSPLKIFIPAWHSIAWMFHNLIHSLLMSIVHVK